MASILPFKKCTLNSTVIDSDEFVEGSGTYVENGLDIDATTADHARHYVRKAIHRISQLQAYGDKTSVQSSGGLSSSQVITLSSGDETFNGIVTAKYSKETETTLITVRSDAASS